MPLPPNLDPTPRKYYPSAARAATAGWTYETARHAVDLHKRGCFWASYQLGIDIWAHPAIKAARERRIASAVSLPWTLSGPDRAPGRIEFEAAQALWPQAKRLLEETVDDVAIQGFAVWQHPVDVVVETDVGPRYEIATIEHWPTSCVEHGSALLARYAGQKDAPGPYDPDRYYAKATGGEWIPLPRPGETDLHWTLLGNGDRPHLRGAICALDHAFVAGQLGRRAMAKLINTIGRTSPLGELPASIQTTEIDADGNERIPAVARDMLAMVQALGEEQAAGIHMNGAKVYPFEVTAQTGNLLPQWAQNAVKEIQWAILGHDMAIAEGDVYADPAKQAIPQDATRRDVGIVERAFSALATGLGRLNAERCGPIELRGHVPDVDQAERRKAEKDERAADDAHRAAQVAAGKACADQLAAERTAGMLVDDARVAEVYALAGLPAPRLKPPAPPQGQPAPSPAAPPS